MTIEEPVVPDDNIPLDPEQKSDSKKQSGYLFSIFIIEYL